MSSLRINKLAYPFIPPPSNSISYAGLWKYGGLYQMKEQLCDPRDFSGREEAVVQPRLVLRQQQAAAGSAANFANFGQAPSFRRNCSSERVIKTSTIDVLYVQ